MHEFEISVRLGSWSEIGVQRYSIKPILPALFPNFSSTHFFIIFLTVLTLFLQGLKNGDMSWKIQEQCLNWNKFHENFWIKSLNFYHCWVCPIWRCFKNARIVLSAVWSITGSTHTKLEYLSTMIKNSTPWNSNDHRPICPKVLVTLNHSSNSQMAVWQRNLLQISQHSHSFLFFPFIPG